MSEGSAQLILETLRLVQTDIKELHDKINSTNITVTQIHEQVKYTNGRVTKIENSHVNCAGKQALEKQIEQETEKKTKETKSYKIGDFLVNLAATSLTASAIIGLILMILK